MMADLGLQRLPLLERPVGAGPARRADLDPAGLASPAAGRRAARSGASMRPADPVSLGPPAGARGPRRLGVARHRVAVRRVRGRRCTRPSATGSDRWATLNEPWCAAFLGYAAGAHAPGRQRASGGASPPAHHLMLGHGLVVEALRAGRPRAVAGHHAQPHGRRRGSTPRMPGDADAARRIDGIAEPVLPRPAVCGASTRRTCVADLRAVLARRPRPRRRSGDDRRARSTSSG